jgi:hypothetical protein
VTFRQNVGMLLAFRVRTVGGRLCRECGRSTGRSLQNRTLLTGWWGIISFFFNCFAVLANAAALVQVGRLAAPVGGDPPRRLAPGRPVLLRAGILVPLAVGLLVVAVFAYDASRGPSVGGLAKGDCVVFTADEGLDRVGCNRSHDGKVLAVANSAGECPPATDSVYGLDARRDRVICIEEAS